MAKMSWVGRRVRFVRDFRTRGGHSFKAGEEATIIQVHHGLTLENRDGFTRLSVSVLNHG
jgi:hypothetical protein